MDEEDFLAAVEADNVGTPVDEPKAEPTEATPEVQPEQPREERQRDEHGRFASKVEPEARPPIAAEPATVTPTPEPQHAPITALLDEREKRQAAERERDELRQRFQQSQRQAEIPDPDLDPAGFAQFQQEQFQTLILDERLNTSERFARKEHGAETVEAAKQWVLGRFAQDPLYRQQVLRHPDPYEKAVTDYKRDQLFSKVSDPSEFDAFLAWKAAQGQLQQQQAAPAAPPNPISAIPPRSLASAPSAGSVLTEPEQTDEEMFAEVIPKG